MSKIRWICRDMVALFLCWQDPGTATWLRITSVMALIYILFPFDLIIDFIPITGWLDDIGIAALAISLLRRNLRPEHLAKAQEICNRQTQR